MLNAHLAQLARRWVHRIRRPDGQPARRSVLRMEAVEERLAPAALPTPTVTNTRVIGQDVIPFPGSPGSGVPEVAGDGNVFASDNGESNGFAPQAAMDPTDPLKQVVVFTEGTGVKMLATLDGGQTWQTVFNNANTGLGNPRTELRLPDPTRDPATVNATNRQWDASSSPAVAFGRGGRLYLTHIQSANDAARSRGVLVADVFDFSGSFPVDLIRNKILYAWNGNDPAYNPTIAVDNNTTTGGQNAGAAPGAVYIAWNTNADVPAGPGVGFNPSAVLMSASSDGGQTFSAPFFVNDNQYRNFFSATNGDGRARMVYPQIAIAPAQPAGSFITPGQVTVGFNSVGTAGGSDLYVTNAAVAPSGTGSPGFVSIDASGEVGFIADGAVTPYDATVAVPAGNAETVVTGVSVTVSLKHPNLNQVALQLVAPDGSVVTLLRNRVNAAGTVISDQIGLGGGDAIGFVRAAKSQGTSFGGRFTSTAPRRINDGNTKAPYNGDMLPEDFFGLRQFEGQALSDLAGDWRLLVTDIQDKNADAKNPQILYGFSINITAGLGDETFGFDRNVVFGSGDALIAGDPVQGAFDGSATNPFPNGGGAAGPVGFGPGLSIAYDTTIGGPNSGNLYLAYTGIGSAAVSSLGGTTTRDKGDIYFMRSTDGGLSFSTVEGFFRPFQGVGLLNTDSFAGPNGGDNYTDGNRTQFQPTLTVDPATGTLVAMWYDARNDASNNRAATYLTTSIDGGNTFSDQLYQYQISKNQALTSEAGFVPFVVTPTAVRQPFLNTPKTAYDATDFNKGVLIEPVPSNAGVANAGNGFGTRQAVLAFGGNIYPFWSGNANRAGVDNQNRAAVQVFTATVTTASGPRVVAADMGPVINPLKQPSLDGFRVVFDRNVDPASFTRASVRVGYTPGNSTTVPAGGNGTPPGTPVSVSAVTVVENPDDPNDTTTFFVRFSRVQLGVGAYSYYIDSSTIRDTITSPLVPTTGPELTPVPPVSSSGDNNAVPVPDPGVARQNNPFSFGPDYDEATRTPVAVSAIDIPVLPDGRAVARTIVTLNIQSTRGENLVVNLVSPSGTRVNLINRAGFTGVAGSQFVMTRLDDDAANSIQDPTLATPAQTYTGSFQPASSTRVFRGETAEGTWRLEVIDLDPTPTVSTIADWSLSVVPIALGAPIVNRMDQNANGISNEPNAVDGFAAPGRLSDTQSAFSGGLDAADTFPLVIPGPRLLGTAVPGRTFDPAVETLYQDLTPSRIDLVFDRNMRAGSFSKDQIVRITGPLGTVFDAVTRQNDLLIPAGNRTAAGKRNLAEYDALRVTAIDPDGDGLATRFTVRFSAQQASGTYSVQVASSITDAAGFQLDNNANAGVARVYRNAASADTFTDTTYSSKLATPAGLAIPSGSVTTPGVVELRLPIGDNAPIAVGTDLAGVLRRVLLRLDIDYPNTPDLTADLIAPAGSGFDTPIRLFSGVGNRGAAGGTRANFRNTLFDDQSNSPIQLGSPPFDNTGSGAFAPQFPLNDLDGVGTRGDWTLRITNTGNQTGRLNYFDLTLPTAVVGSGVGEPTADRGTGTFRLYNIDPTASPGADGRALSERQWTPVGPAAIGGGANGAPSRSSRTTGLAVDPSDPSGNTVYVGAASGGVWKTNNFLDPAGEPTYIPLTDFGPAFSLNVGGIEAIGRNGDPNQTILIVATGEGDIGSAGVGFLLSFDAGRSWQVLDSTVNVNPTAAGRPFLTIADPTRDRLFVGASTFKIVADPVPQANGDYYLYAAVSGGRAGANGVWRSRDTGRTWERIQAGNATDVVLALGTAPQRPNPGGSGTITGNTEVLYAAVRGFGVFSTPQATSTAPAAVGAPAGTGSMSQLTGVPGGNQLRRDIEDGENKAIPIGSPTANPNGGKGRITLATPALTGDRRLDVIYSGWLYAVVSAVDESLDGIYVTKDFGANWTPIRIPVFDTTPGFLGGGVSTLNKTLPDNPLFGSNGFGQGNYDQAIAVDPNNPSVIYVGGSQNGSEVAGGGYIRVDISNLSDAQNLTAYSNSQPNEAADTVQFNTSNAGSLVVKTNPPSAGPGGFYGLVGFDPQGVDDQDLRFRNIGGVNVARDPLNPLLGSNSTLFFFNVDRITNTGFGAKWQPFFGEVTTDVHRILTMRDPLTGKTRIITADDQGTATVVDNGDGTFDNGIGLDPDRMTVQTTDQRVGVYQPTLFRNGNLQINQLYQGAVQPSQLAADIAGSLFYGSTQDNGSPRSTLDPLDTAFIKWDGPGGDATGVATDQTGSGTAFQFRWPCCSGNLSDFFRVLTPQPPVGSGNPPLDVGRTNGLVRSGDDIRNSVGNWAFVNGSNIAVNPIDGQGLLVSGNLSGRLFRSTDQGSRWELIEDPNQPSVTGGSYAPALAFGAPEPNDLGLLNNYVLVGTQSGRSFVSFTGTFSGAQTNPDGTVNWREISVPNDGSSVRQLVTNPRRGTRDAYMVTFRGVYYIADTRDPNQNWQNISGNLFNLTRPAYFGDATDDATPALRSLEAIAADWRFANPIGGPTDTAPTLYVGGEGGVFRSDDRGATWTLFPDMASDGAAADGGYFPAAQVTDLDLSIGNIDPVSGLPQADGALNLLVASTYGRGMFAIRLDTTRPNNVLFQSGPRVADEGGIQNPNPRFMAGTASTSDRLFVTFDTAVNPASVSAADFSLIDPRGKPVTITGVSTVSNTDAFGVDRRNKFLVTFDPQTRRADEDAPFSNSNRFGKYSLSIGVQTVGGKIDLFDFAGNRMNQNGNMVNGEVPGDVFNRSIFLNQQATNLVLIGLPGQVVAGESSTVTLRVEDGADGSLKTDFTGRVSFDIAARSGETTPSRITFTAADRGQAQFPVTFNRAGTRTLTATADGNAANPATVSTVVIAANATQFVVVDGYDDTTAGQAETFTLEARDDFRNRDRGYRGTVAISSPTDATFTVALASAPDTPLTPANTYTFKAGDAGRVQFSGVFTKAGTDNRIQFLDTKDANLSGLIKNIVVNPDVAKTFVITDGLPAVMTAGVPDTLTVEARDRFQNVATGHRGRVAFALTDGTAPRIPTATFTASGQVSVPVEFRKAADVQRVTVSDPDGVVTGGRESAKVIAASAIQFGVAGFPGMVKAGQSQPLTITALDPFGNTDTGFSGVVTIGGSDGTSGTVSFGSVDNGVVTGTARLTKAGSGRFVSATAGSLTGTQTGITVVPDAANRVTVTALPDPYTAGAPSLLTATAFDQFGNVDSGYAGTLELTSTDSKATLPDPYMFMASDAGSKTFTVVLRSAGVQTVSAEPDTPDVAGADTTVTVVAGAATTFVLSGFPQTVQVGSSKNLTVTARDAFGNLASNFAGTVVFSSSDAAAVLPGPSTLSDGTGTFPVTLNTPGVQSLTVTDQADPNAFGVLPGITVPTPPEPPPVVPPPPPPANPLLVGFSQFAVGADAGLTPSVRLFNAADRSERFSLTLFDPLFTGGVRTAAGDFNGDGVADLVAGIGPGAVTAVQVFDGKTQQLLLNIQPFEDEFTGGVYVAVGDVTGDGVPDLIISPDEGGGPRIDIYSGAGFAKVGSFFAFPDDPNFRGGARAAVGDVNGDGVGDIVVSAGFGGGPRIATFDGKSVTTASPVKLFNDFFAFETDLRNGAFVAVGDVDGDGKADIVAGGGPGGGPRVTIFSGTALLASNTQLVLANFFGGDTDNRGGIRVAVKNVDNDTKADVLVGAGTGAGTRVTGYLGSTLTLGAPPVAFELDTLPTFDGGVFVG